MDRLFVSMDALRGAVKSIRSLWPDERSLFAAALDYKDWLALSDGVRAAEWIVRRAPDWQKDVEQLVAVSERVAHEPDAADPDQSRALTARLEEAESEFRAGRAVLEAQAGFIEWYLSQVSSACDVLKKLAV